MAEETPASINLREMGDLAAWSASTAKPGNGVDVLRDCKMETFWQSDGATPHLINIEFQRRVSLAELHLYLDYKLDESYTPQKISVKAGTSYHDLKELVTVDLEEPSGWIVVPLTPENSDHLLRTFFLQVMIVSNHQSGRDSHVRQILVFGPKSDPYKGLGLPCQLRTKEFAMYAAVR